MSRRIAPLPPIVLSPEEKRERELARQRARPRRGRASRGVPRAKVIAVKRLTRAVLAAEAFATTLVPADVLAERPRTRGDCVDGERPCPWVSCKHHLYLDVNPENGSIKLNRPDLEPWELEHSCALDLADRGGLTLEDVGLVTNLTRERIRQVEVRGLLALKRHPLSAALGD